MDITNESTRGVWQMKNVNGRIIIFSGDKNICELIQTGNTAEDASNLVLILNARNNFIQLEKLLALQKYIRIPKTR